ERLLSAIGPLVVLQNLVVWLGLYLVGYGLILWPLMEGPGDPRLDDALRASGSSLFTLGFAAPAEAAPTALVLLAAATGIIVIALKIAYLPVLYGQFAVREAGVASFASRIGVPPWGPRVLTVHHEQGIEATLPAYFEEWCGRVAEIGVAHAHYPTLVYFRASIPRTSWIASLVAMLDAANLLLACSPRTAPQQCRLLLLTAPAGLRRLVEPLRLVRPQADLCLDRVAFQEAVELMRRAGVMVERDGDHAWEAFAARRATYAPAARALLHLTLAPPAPWLGSPPPDVAGSG
ncbi:MAG: hypothetical protein ACR2N6_02210, partial [Miltoncostaeaceae bacterium]